MANIDLAAITDPISDEQPCGPDLDMEFDGDFMNFEANVSMAWPERYFSWDPASLKGHTYYDQIGELLERTRDLRVLVPLAKLRILEGDLPGFAETIDAIHRLLKEHWADVHPQAADFLELGMGQLSTLDDNASSVLPFQHTRIVASRRSGPITLRKWLIAAGEANPREEEERYDSGTLTAAIAEADEGERDGSLAALKQARDALAGIRLVCIEEAGYESAPTLDNLPKALENAIAMIESATGSAGDGDAASDGTAGDAAGGAAAGGSASVLVQLPAGSVANREDAIEAMHAAAKYFALNEPSSPAPILLREAQNAASKNFYELVNDLMPDTASSAYVTFGREPWFEVSLSMLDQRNPSPDYTNDAPAESEDSSWEDAGLEDEAVSDNDEPTGKDAVLDESSSADDGSQNDDYSSTNDDVSQEASSNDQTAEPEAESSWGESSNDDVQNDAVEASAGNDAVVEDEVEETAEDDGEKFVANSRPEAVELMNKVLTYYRVAEPTSPVALIIERALELASKNFIELLGDVLPDGSLKVKDPEQQSSSGW